MARPGEYGSGRADLDHAERSRLRDEEFQHALRTCPGVAYCPWMRVEVQSESGGWLVFAMAVWHGWIVGGAPIAKKSFGMRAEDAWRFWRARGAKLSRIG